MTMLHTINAKSTLQPCYQAYCDALAADFRGDIASDYATRLSVATDNSIYQVIPQAVIFPRDTDDMVHALTLAASDTFRTVTFSPRGGGTATNGQSLSAGIIIDCSRHMRAIVELNLDERWVRVQPGVVLDQLNQYLLPLGFHFAPEISTSNRATIGGMINTDACGNGSKTLGRTSDHVLDITAVLSNGQLFNTSTSHFPEVAALLEKHQALIRERFPNAPRTLSGYNLLKAYHDQLNLNYLICGSEGTLAVVSECKLKISPIPAHKKVIVIQYRHFDDALRAPELSNDIKPLVIEAIDEKLLDLARSDAIYPQIKNFIEQPGHTTGAINIVEFVADDERELENQIKKLCQHIDARPLQPGYALGYYIAKNAVEAKLLWDLRKKSVGLISKRVVGSKRPIPFIEDTAVPPEKLADYIHEFKALLDRYQLTYGMYGHVDAGCVHVRPALDMTLVDDEKLLRTLSNEVVALIQKYQGVMWGEHGAGHRAEYSAEFFGETLYDVIRQIKTFFDPQNQLNPGKIAVPFNCQDSIVTISGPLRGQFDKQISEDAQNAFPSIMACNGNGACFNFSSQETMCPSFKVTHNRIHSPKGRAVLMREWLRQLSLANLSFATIKPVSILRKWVNRFDRHDFSHEVHAAMQGCLGCKACVTQCPLNVDIPNTKAQFLEAYYKRYSRPMSDYLVASIETLASLQARFRFINILLSFRWVQWLFKTVFKLVDLPLVPKQNTKLTITTDVKTLTNLTPQQQEKSVILLQDAFTTFYDTKVISDTYQLLTELGFNVFIMPFFVNGKAMQVMGFLKRFKALAQKNANFLNQLASLGIPIIGLDPSITLTYRDEYKIVDHHQFNVLLPQEWLSQQLQRLPNRPSRDKSYYLLSHCSEKAACSEAEMQWQTVFNRFGLTLKPLTAGCCGMAGIYGHEREHKKLSSELFHLDWQRHLHAHDDHILATGYSCRSQAKRLAAKSLRHPLSALWEEYSLYMQLS